MAIFLAVPYAQAQTAAGKTMIAKGNVAAEQNSESRNLKRRSPIYDNEKVTTGDNSKAQLRMTDGGMIALKENSELVIADYNYTDETGRGSVAMELLKGGLRSVTGAIKAERGDYNLQTPVGSIGIRGTHFEVELVDGDMFLAVWDGAIDVTVNTGQGEPQVVSFGEGEDFSFGVVSEEGEVTELLQAPDTFEQGHSSNEESDEEDDSTEQDTTEQTEENNQEQEQQQEQVDQSSSDEGEGSEENSDDEPTVEEIAEGESIVAIEEESAPEAEEPPTEQIDEELGLEIGNELTEDIDKEFQEEEQDESFLSADELNGIGAVSIEELVSQRQGNIVYGSDISGEAESSMGEISNFAMGMTIDFDSGTVPTGQMSFEDSGGEWFVAFSGIISTANLDLDVTFASHGNNLADGDITASFFDGLDSIVGEFDLYEIQNPDVKVKGNFLIK